MTTYGYRCRECGTPRDSQLRDDTQPCDCGGVSRRDFSSVRFGVSAFQPHFNHAVGAYVNSDREFSDMLKIRAEQNTVRTGAEHSYVRVDPGDLPTPTKDDHMFETQAKTIADKGINLADIH